MVAMFAAAVVVVLLAARFGGVRGEGETQQERIDRECVVTREDVVEKVIKSVDVNGDGRVDVDEISQYRAKVVGLVQPALVAMSKVMPAKAAALQAFVGNETVAKIMDHCDADGDGYVTVQDAHASEHTCMRHCRDRIIFDAMYRVTQCPWYWEGVCISKSVWQLATNVVF